MQRLAAREEVRLGQLVEAVDQKLHHEDGQEHGGHLEEQRQVHAVPVARPQPRQRRRGHDPTGGTEHQVDRAAPLRHQRAHQQRRFHPLARDHQEREEEHAGESPSAHLGRRHRQAMLDIALDGLGVPPHVDDERGDQDRGGERQHPFPQRLVRGALEEDCGDDAQHHRGRDAPVHRRDELWAAALAEIRKADGDDEKRLEPFPEGDDEGLQHGFSRDYRFAKLRISLRNCM